MKTANARTPLTDPTLAAGLLDAQWVALHVPRFAAVAAAYGRYTTFLETTLKAACPRLAPQCVVEARSKGIASFAEKILRKRSLYTDPADLLPPDPLVRLTDLCGARVVCQTASQVHAVCRFIERAFDIDWANSEDVSRRLRTAEFGYRSVHYIVLVNPRKLREAGVATRIPAGIAGLKAEIQVRTLLEHASSSLGHDTIYKTELKVPEAVQRDYASVAAVLEGADHDIERILGIFNSFRSNFGAWHDRSEVEQEIEYAKVLLGLPDKHLPVAAKVPVAVRAGQLAIAIGRHAQAVALLQPFRALPHAGIQRILGHALVEFHWPTPTQPAFAEGRAHLQRASELAPDDAEVLGLLAECAMHLRDDVEARQLFARALAADGAEPLTMVRYLEFETAAHSNDHLLSLAGPMLRTALERAGKQIETRANLAGAWSAAAVAHLFLKEPFPALHALAQVIRLCDGCATPAGKVPACPACPCACGRAMLRLKDTVRRLRGIRQQLPGFDWFERLLLLGLAARPRDPGALAEVAALASWHGDEAKVPANEPHFQPDRSILLLAGGCAAEVEEAVTAFGEILQTACAGLELDLVSGGTCAGISGVAGEIAAKAKGRIQAFGYLPSNLPRKVREDAARYTRLVNVPGTDFSPLDALQAWTDLLAAGIEPAKVRLLCYAPGDIARAECAIALALGVRVGVVVDQDLPLDRRFDAAPWEGCANLLLLPKDPMTFRAFVQIGSQELSAAELKRLEPAAKLAHADYVRSATPKDPSLQSWDKLADSLKLSNYLQVAYWENVLHEYGLGVRPLTDGDKARKALDIAKVLAKVLPRKLAKDPIAALAEVEHGRWNVERLSYGWRYAKEKDVAKKLSPYLIPWQDVPEEIQKFDLVAIAELPKKLRLAGLELYRLPSATK